MTTLKTVTIAAVLLAGGASPTMAQNGPATGGEYPVAGGAAGGGVSRLWKRLWVRGSSALRLRGSGIRLRRSRLCGAGHGRNDRYYRDASTGPHSAIGVRGTTSLHSTACDYRLLRCACGFSADICLRTRIWVWLHTRLLEPRLLGRVRVWVALSPH